MTDTHFFGLWDCPNCGKSKLISEQLHCPSCGKDMPLKANGYPDTRMPDDSEVSEYEIHNAEVIGRIQRREGVWECRFCDGVHPDEDAFCDKCGASKAGIAKEVEPKISIPSSYVASDSPSYSNDWQCKSCLHMNADEANACVQCGTPRSAIIDEPEEEPNYIPISEPHSSFGFESEPRFRLSSVSIPHLLIILAVGILLVLGGIWGYREFIVRETLPATIQSVSWYRAMPVEIYTWVDDSNQSGCPTDSRSCTSGREVVGQERYQSGSHQEPVYSSRTVSDGETCTTSQNPNGSYTRSCTPRTRSERYISGYNTVPDYSYRNVYGTVYRFQVQRWVFSRNLTTSGNDWEPYWFSDYTLGRNGEQERLSGNNTESYSIVLVTADGKTHNWNSNDETEWHAFQSGEASFEVILNGNGGLISAGRRHLVEE